MAEVTLLAQKAGVKRSAFLEFLNDSVMGSTFTRYKTPAFVNLDWTTTFPPTGQRKDMDLGLALARQLEVPMPVTAATREMFQATSARTAKPDGEAQVEQDFAALFETMATARRREARERERRDVGRAGAREGRRPAATV